MRKCLRTFRVWLITKYGYSREQAIDTIDEYHATLAEDDKTWIYAEFKKKDSKIRLLCGTEAISTGLNVSDIANVIQVGMVRDGNANILLQRLGRGGRKGQQALGIFFIEAQWTREVSEKRTRHRSRQKRRASVRGIFVAADDSAESDLASDNERWEDIEASDDESPKRGIPDVLYEFCHTETRCLRTILLDHYKEADHFRGGRDPNWCCSICNPQLATLTELPPPPRKGRGGRPKAGENRAATVLLMKGWCTQLANEKLLDAVFDLDCQLIMSDNDLKEVCRPLATVEEMKHSIIANWKWKL